LKEVAKPVLEFLSEEHPDSGLIIKQKIEALGEEIFR
jgi:hypothetical protein